MSKLILVFGPIMSLAYIAYFFFAVRWRVQHDRKDKEKRRSGGD